MSKRANSENRQRYLAAVKRSKFIEVHGKGSIPSGSRGFLFSHAMNREKDSMREAFNWLKFYANEFEIKLPSEENDVELEGKDDAEEEDISAALARETADISTTKKGEKPKRELFRQYNTKCKNIIYIHMDEDAPITPMDFTIRALNSIKAKGVSQARHLMRIMPVHTTVETNKKNVEKAIFDIVQLYFPDASNESPRTYCCQFKARNNANIDRQFVFDTTTNFVRNRDPFAKVNLTQAKYIIDVQVLGNVSCVSVYEQFAELKKYNLQNICEQPKQVDEIKEEVKIEVEVKNETQNICEQPKQVDEIKEDVKSEVEVKIETVVEESKEEIKSEELENGDN